MKTGILLGITALFLLSVLIYAVGFIVSKVRREKESYIYAVVPILLLVLAVVSWLACFDWQRLIYTLFMVPLVHSAAFILVSAFSVKNMDSCKIRISVIFLWITYILPYILLPQEGDMSVPRALFGLIEGADLTLLSVLAKILFLTNAAVLILLTVNNVVAASRKKSTQEELETNLKTECRNCE